MKQLLSSLTQEQINFYYEKGYLIVNDVLTEEECDIYNNQVRKQANNDFQAILNPDRIEFLISQTLEKINKDNSLKNNLLYIEECKLTSKMTWDIISNPIAVNVLETLQQSKISYLMSQMLFKEANSPYAPQAWSPHQDNTYPRNENNKLPNRFTTQYITTNFFLKGANKSTGNLYVYPGSHKFGLYDAENHISYREQKGNNPGNKIPDEILDQFEKIDCEFKKGDMLVLNGNCIHGSYANEHPTKSRPLLSVSYITTGEFFISGNNAHRIEIPL